jgi:adenylosuccinate lyase
MATENLLMAAVAKGGDRQELHERIRRHSHTATAALKGGAAANPLVDLLRSDPAFTDIDLAAELDPARFVGRAPQQVVEFLQDVVRPIRAKYPKLLSQSSHLTV